MTTPSNPYVGPRPFTAAERGRFFGREREARDLLSLVIAKRLVLFYAQSGAGKSSLLNTSLIPNLHEAGFATLPVGRVGGDLPDRVGPVDNIFIFNLLLNLDQSQGDVNRLTQLNLSDFLARLTTTDGESFHYDETLPLPPPDAPRPSTEEGQPYVLLIDQFEELITNHLDRWHERAGFFQQLETAMQRDPMLWVVLTLREDFVAALDPYRHYLRDKLRTRFYMQRLGYAEALRAIQEPAALGQRPFAKGVAEKLANDLRQIKRHGRAERMVGQFIEPVQLQVVCYRLWDNLSLRPLGPITMTDLAELGDVDVALSQFYEQALYNSLSTDPNVTEATLRDWFSHELITEAHTRGTVYYGETHTAGLPNQFVHNLENEYIIRAESRAGALWYELVHDRFVEPILAANQAWLAATRQLNPLLQSAQTWQETGKPPELLYRDALLQAAEQTYQADTAESVIVEFMEASRNAQRERELIDAKKRARRSRVFVVVLALLSVLAIGAAIFGFYQRSQAIAREKDAIEARKTSQAALIIASENEATVQAAFRRGIVLQIRVEQEKNQAIAARATLAKNLKNMLATQTAVAQNVTPTPTIPPTSTGTVESAVNKPTFTPTASPTPTPNLIATQLFEVNSTQTVVARPTVYDTPSPTPTPSATTALPTETIAAVYPPSYRILFKSTRTRDALFMINADGRGEVPLPILGEGREPNYQSGIIAFSGKRDSTNYRFTYLHTITLDSQNEVDIPRQENDNWSPSLSMDGQKIAFVSSRTGSWDIYLMDIDGTSVTPLTLDMARDAFPAISPDGKYIAFTSRRTDKTGTSEDTQNIWRVNIDGTNLTQLTNDSSDNTAPSWSPDSKQIAYTSAKDGSYDIHIMDVNGHDSRNLTNSPTNENFPSWSPDGHWIAFSRDIGNNQIFIMTISGDKIYRVTYSNNNDSQPVWIPPYKN